METPLALLLWMDEQYPHPAALPASFGDRYLYGVNPVFRGVRDLALRLGVEFRISGGELGRQYTIAPLLTLSRLLETGAVPYAPNGDFLRQIAAESPSARMMEADLRLVKQNYLMHESAHLVAHRLLRPAGLNSTVESLLAESFANAADAIGESFAVQKAHQTIYAMNSYMANTREARLALIRGLIAAFGFREVFAMALWIFFYLNCHAGSSLPGPAYLCRAYESAAKDTDSPGPLQQLLGHGAAAAFSLNVEFRKGTTPLYFRLVSQEESFQSISSMDFESSAIDTLQIADGVAILAGAAVEFGSIPTPAGPARPATSTPNLPESR